MGHLPGRGILGAIVASGTLLAFTLNPSPASAQEEDDLPQEQVSATAIPSVVYISTTWSGYVEVPIGDSYQWFGPYEAYSACSGFIASPDGYIGTANHCVTPDAGIEIAIIDAFFQEQLDEGVFTEADVDELYDEAAETWTVEGAGAIGTPVDLTLTEVWPTVAASGIQVSQPFEAVVSKSTPVSTGGDDSGLAGGDVALLKIDTQGVDLPALELAPEEPETGEAVTSIGFPGSVEDVVDPTLEPSAKSGTVSSSQNVEGAPFTEISSAMSGGMSGGPTVDSQGRVIGVNSFGPTGEEESFNFVTGTDSLDALYAQFDIPRELNSTDTAYRAGLDSYFAEDYDAAVEQFDTVLASQPNHAQAQKYRSEAAQAAPAESDSSSAPIVPIAAGLVVLGAGTAGFFIYRSRRKPPTPPAPPTWTAVPDPGLPDPQEQAREADRRVAGW